ncbi:hypothetical protein [Cesiribacter andamanensis]|uniref:Outer membrane protein beta-barrel domain-containing protein n=1 Tax=Cesiribacter andamanensis AMV16 TaxID=1279009 RepID=M7NWL0_9BACT|nr:hypothetical protein [Cesiribacter andamanensis]EMR02824.1 hypothetical protein ADICEAN_02032 [Cesiribacter andamanensis AMV16]
MRATILLVCGYLLMVSGYAQEKADYFLPPKFQVGVQLGLSTFSMVDRAVSPLLYQGRYRQVGLQLLYTGNRSRVELSLQGKLGNFAPAAHRGKNVYFRELQEDGSIRETAVPLQGGMLAPAVKLGYWHRLGSPHALQVSAGAVLSEQLLYPQGFVQPGLMNVLALSPQLRLTYAAATRHQFEANVAAAALGLVTRPPYHGTLTQPNENLEQAFLKHNTRFQTLDKLKLLQAELQYQYRMGLRTTAVASYQLSWMREKEPRPLSLAESAYNLSFFYLFPTK